jgi:hypothetical protein
MKTLRQVLETTDWMCELVKARILMIIIASMQADGATHSLEAHCRGTELLLICHLGKKDPERLRVRDAVLTQTSLIADLPVCCRR